MKPRIKYIPSNTVTALPVKVALVASKCADDTPEAKEEITLLALIYSSSEKVTCELSIVLEPRYFTNRVSGSPVVASAFE